MGGDLRRPPSAARLFSQNATVAPRPNVLLLDPSLKFNIYWIPDNHLIIKISQADLQGRPPQTSPLLHEALIRMKLLRSNILHTESFILFYFTVAATSHYWVVHRSHSHHIFFGHLVRNSKYGKLCQVSSRIFLMQPCLRRNDCGTTISPVQNPDRINPNLSVQDSPEQKLVCRIWVRVRKVWEYLRQSGHLLCHSKGRDVANLAR